MGNGMGDGDGYWYAIFEKGWRWLLGDGKI